jgi:hypothetical protein
MKDPLLFIENNLNQLTNKDKTAEKEEDKSD